MAGQKVRRSCSFWPHFQFQGNPGKNAAAGIYEMASKQKPTDCQPTRMISLFSPPARFPGAFKCASRFAAFCCPALILLAFASGGCQSPHDPGSMSHASVQIKGRTLPEIQQTAAEVFRGEGYNLTVSRPGQQVYDRMGSRADAIKWGGVLDGSGVVMRVKVDYTLMPDQAWLLQANAYAVRDASDPFFTKEDRNIILNRWPYQSLLNEVKKRLKQE